MNYGKIGTHRETARMNWVFQNFSHKTIISGDTKVNTKFRNSDSESQNSGATAKALRWKTSNMIREIISIMMTIIRLINEKQPGSLSQ